MARAPRKKPAPRRATRRLDCRGLLCPLPVLEAEKALKRLSAPFTLTVLADDPAARIDFEALAWRRGLALEAKPPVFRLMGRKRAGPLTQGRGPRAKGRA